MGNSASAPMVDVPTAAGSVLVVEDNDTTRDRIATILRRRGYDVIEAMDGLQALRKVTSRRFDAIVLDLVLPHVDGWQFRATQLRHPELSSIPTVIVTVQPLRQPDRYSLRTTDVIHKPFEDETILQAVERACQTRQPIAATLPPHVNGLFWSRRGEVACADHAPDASSQRWQEESWAPMPADAGLGRIRYRCQHCPGDHRPIDRSRP